MSADRIPYEAPTEAETAKVRQAIERKKSTENLRDATAQLNRRTDDVGGK